jgi:hypothetical protein
MELMSSELTFNKTGGNRLEYFGLGFEISMLSKLKKHS